MNCELVKPTVYFNISGADRLNPGFSPTPPTFSGRVGHPFPHARGLLGEKKASSNIGVVLGRLTLSVLSKLRKSSEAVLLIEAVYFLASGQQLFTCSARGKTLRQSAITATLIRRFANPLDQSPFWRPEARLIGALTAQHQPYSQQQCEAEAQPLNRIHGSGFLRSGSCQQRRETDTAPC